MTTKPKRKPMGYLVHFLCGVQELPNGGYSATGAGEVIAYSLRHVASVLNALDRRPNMKADITPLWGPVWTDEKPRQSFNGPF